MTTLVQVPNPVPVHAAWRPRLGNGPMQAHQRMPWKPAPLPYNPELELGQNGAQIKAAVLGALLVPTALAGVVSYVGFKLGSSDEGLASVLGYIVGVLGGIGALVGVMGMLGLAAIPFEIKPKTSEVATLPSASI